jgi:hypothetical protein
MDSVWARRGPDAPALRARSRVQPCSPRRPLTTSFLANHPSSHPHVLAQRPAQTTGTAGHAGDAELIPDPRPRTRTAEGRLCVGNCRPRRANAAFRILDAQHPISPWPWAWPCHGETDISRVARVTRQLLRVCDRHAPRLSSCLREDQLESQPQGHVVLGTLPNHWSPPGHDPGQDPTPSHGAPGPSAELSNNRLDPLLLCNFFLSFFSQLPIQPRVSTI